MNKIEINFENDPNLQGNVQLSVQSFSFTWTLNYLGTSQKSISRRYFSPFLHAADSTWQMHLIVVAKNESEAKTCETDLQNQVIVYIARHGSEKDSCYMKYKVSLLNDEGCIATAEGEEFRKWIDCLFKSEEKNMFSSLMKKDTLFVRCELTTLYPTRVNPSSTAMKCSDNSLKVNTKYVSSNCMLSDGLQQPVMKYIFRHFKPQSHYVRVVHYLYVLAVAIMLLLVHFAFDYVLGEIPDKMPAEVDSGLKIEEMDEYIIDTVLKMEDILTHTLAEEETWPLFAPVLRYYNNLPTLFV